MTAMVLAVLITAFPTRRLAAMQPDNRDDVFALISRLLSALPFERRTIESLLGAVLRLTGENEYFFFFEGQGRKLVDGLAIQGVDFRQSKSNPRKALLAFQVHGLCVPLRDVRARYGELELVNAPRGRSLDEETSHSVVQAGVRIGFGFNQRNPDCLASVVLEPIA